MKQANLESVGSTTLRVVERTYLQQLCYVVEISGHIWVVGAQRLLVDCKGATLGLLCLLQLALGL